MINYETVKTSPEDFRALVDFMQAFMRVNDPRFEADLLEILQTKVYYRPMALQSEGKLADKAFFVAKGLVFAFFYDQDQEIAAFRIFRAGEIALIPESFMNGKVAKYSLMVCADTRLLEISLEQMQLMYGAFPQAVMLALLIVADMFDKDVATKRMLLLGHKKRILRFYELYPELFGNMSFLFRDMYIARHLNMSPVTFSRLRSELFPGYPALSEKYW